MSSPTFLTFAVIGVVVLCMSCGLWLALSDDTGRARKRQGHIERKGRRPSDESRPRDGVERTDDGRPT